VRPEERVLDKVLYEFTSSTLALPSVLRLVRQSDVVLCIVPTLLAATYASLIPRRPRLVMWVQDLVIRAAASLSMSSTSRRAIGAATRLERLAFTRADHLVVCSPGFREYLVALGVDSARIEVLYNWADVDAINFTPPTRRREGVKFLYAGNVGYTQGLETLLDAGRILGDGVSIEIVGEGNARRAIAELAREVPNVAMRIPVPSREFGALLADHDVHLVIQRRTAAEANLPSKISTYLSSGRPVIASVSGRTSAAALLEESGAALVVEPESPELLASAMSTLASDPDRRARLGANGRLFAEARLNKEQALTQLEHVLLG
jgi:glycosyltransferase involved in cell wall biosynthesis